MNRTISINLGGMFFHIEDEAYHALARYLEAVNNYFKHEEGAAEIVEDIEGRIAEMFSESLNKHKRQVVLLNDVEFMIGVMGLPEEFDDPLSADTKNTNQSANNSFNEPQTAGRKQSYGQHEETKRLYRNPDDKLIAGVCSGLSAYFGINDPIWMRLAFLLIVFGGFGTGIILYFVLALIVPKATTSAQKLAMKGKPINVQNIGKTIKENINDFSKGFDEIGKKGRNNNGGFFLTVCVVLFAAWCLWLFI